MPSTFDNTPAGRDPTPDSDLRIGDAERERVANVVSEAAAAGYLDLAELDERLEMVWSARTAAQLEPATADLPQALGDAQQPHRPSRSRSRTHGRTNPDLQRHLVPYLVGMAVMVTIWLAVGIASGAWYPWVIWPALGWGLSVACRASSRPATHA